MLTLMLETVSVLSGTWPVEYLRVLYLSLSASSHGVGSAVVLFGRCNWIRCNSTMIVGLFEATQTRCLVFEMGWRRMCDGENVKLGLYLVRELRRPSTRLNAQRDRSATPACARPLSVLIPARHRPPDRLSHSHSHIRHPQI